MLVRECSSILRGGGSVPQRGGSHLYFLDDGEGQVNRLRRVLGESHRKSSRRTFGEGQPNILSIYIPFLHFVHL